MIHARKIYSREKKCEECMKHPKSNILYVIILEGKSIWSNEVTDVELIRLCKNCIPKLLNALKEVLKKKKKGL